MPSTTTSPSPLFSQLTSVDSIDAKARAEFERDRQRAHKGQDARKKLSHNHHHLPHSPPPLSPKSKRSPSLHPTRRSSLIDWDDMEDVEFTSVVLVNSNDDGLENNARSLSIVSLEDFVVRPGSATNKKARKSASRTSLSRQASTDNILSSMASISLTSSSLPPISESQPTPLLCPMLAPDEDDDLLSLDQDDNAIDWLSCQLYPRDGNDDWTMDEIEDGGLRFHHHHVAPQQPTNALPSSIAVVVDVQSCVW